MTRRVMGVILMIGSLGVYLLHLEQQGSKPHAVWALPAGVGFIFGLWLALPRLRKGRE